MRTKTIVVILSAAMLMLLSCGRGSQSVYLDSAQDMWLIVKNNTPFDVYVYESIPVKDISQGLGPETPYTYKYITTMGNWDIVSLEVEEEGSFYVSLLLDYGYIGWETSILEIKYDIFDLEGNLIRSKVGNHPPSIKKGNRYIMTLTWYEHGWS